MAKKDFSNVDTSPLYEMQELAIAPADDLNGAVITNPEDAPSEELLEELLESGAVLPEDKQADYEELIKRATARREKAQQDIKKLKAQQTLAEIGKIPRTNKSQPRAGKVAQHFYLSEQQHFYLEIRANFEHVTKQQLLAEMVQEAMDKDPNTAQILKMWQTMKKDKK